MNRRKFALVAQSLENPINSVVESVFETEEEMQEAFKSLTTRTVFYPFQTSKPEKCAINRQVIYSDIEPAPKMTEDDFCASYNLILSEFTEALCLRINTAENLKCEIRQTSVIIGLAQEENPQKFMWASDFEISVSLEKIQIANAGGFNPSDLAQTWRIIHASNVLQNWDAVMTLCKEACAKFCELQETYYNQ